MKTLMVVLSSFLLSSSTWAEPSQLYRDLALKDLDQMSDMVKKKVRQSKQASSDKIGPLQDALQQIFCRPDEDRMIDKVIGTVRAELEENEAWETSLSALTEEAINGLKEPKEQKGKKLDLQVTYAIFLENVIANLKPQAKTDGYEKNLLTKIRDAHIDLSKAVKSERREKMLKDTPSPSDQAAAVLEGRHKKQKGDEF